MFRGRKGATSNFKKIQPAGWNKEGDSGYENIVQWRARNAGEKWNWNDDGNEKYNRPSQKLSGKTHQ